MIDPDNQRHPTSEARGIAIGLALIAAIAMTAALFAGAAKMRANGVASIPQHVEARQ